MSLLSYSENSSYLHSSNPNTWGAEAGSSPATKTLYLRVQGEGAREGEKN